MAWLVAIPEHRTNQRGSHVTPATCFYLTHVTWSRGRINYIAFTTFTDPTIIHTLHIIPDNW